ncbi:hypothetical protein [Limnoglobus roseus]|uniref:Uncharacterized protein n=1 Tax=Limnoglobus roseus TaxID=2598579 RepID=A0A5C1AM71_9BACT|nr:hypothetical protein [Limnoglobus roseus]QEL20509.1 hypothetical protein PX52LOC_07613 [Limnoglobus roseus]
MQTNVVEFAGVFYAATYRVQGNQVVLLGTHKSDRGGVRAWLRRNGYAASGAYLFPAAGTLPGFFMKPYASDLYYRVDPATGQADGDALTEFGDPVTVTERDGFRDAV